MLLLLLLILILGLVLGLIVFHLRLYLSKHRQTYKRIPGKGTREHMPKQLVPMFDQH
jgi:hypothetical protein